MLFQIPFHVLVLEKQFFVSEFTGGELRSEFKDSDFFFAGLRRVLDGVDVVKDGSWGNAHQLFFVVFFEVVGEGVFETCGRSEDKFPGIDLVLEGVSVLVSGTELL